MPGLEALKLFLSHATATGSKSATTKPMGWLVVILISGLVAGIAVQAPPWMLVVLASLTGLSVVAFVVAYFVSLFRDADLLRSETFVIQRIAIEHGLYGDSESGLPKLPALPPLEREEEASE